MENLYRKYKYKIDDTVHDPYTLLIDHFRSGDFVSVYYTYTLPCDIPGYEAGEELEYRELYKIKFIKEVKNTPIHSDDIHGSYVVNDREDLIRVINNVFIPKYAKNIKVQYYHSSSKKIVQAYRPIKLEYICDCCHKTIVMDSTEHTLENLEREHPEKQLIWEVDNGKHYCYECLDKPIGSQKTVVQLIGTDSKLFMNLEEILKKNDWNIEDRYIENKKLLLNIFINKTNLAYTKNMLKQLEDALNITIRKSKIFKSKTAKLNAKVYSYIVD